tara:strand:+ start:89 stop:406 length:318 start_codon:yes stop_codon:yes gene_type:complete
MTVKKPAFIYSVIVETLKACRTKETGAGASLKRKVDTYTAAVIITMCKDAVEERRDIRDFRRVCEEILATVLRLRRDSKPDIHPVCRHRLVKDDLMVASDDLTVA